MVLKIKNHKKYNHYRIEEVKPGDVVQLNFKKNLIRVKKSCSTIIEITRIDPSGSGLILGKGKFDFVDVDFLFHVDYIYRDYTLDPLTGEYSRAKKIPEFTR